MASAHNDRAPVILTEEDVPGASLTYAQLERHSVEQLRRWLLVGVPWHEAIRQQVSAATEVSDLSRRLLGEFVLFTTGITFC